MSRPIRILELRSVVGTGGGPDKTILLGAAQTDRQRFDVTVAYVRDVRDHVFGIDVAARRAGVDYVEVRERHSADWAIVPALRELVRTRHIDLVHAHDYKTNLLALMLSRSDRIVPLTTAHGWSGHSLRERAVYYPIDRRLMRGFPRVVAVSAEIATMLERAGVRPERILVLPNGIDHKTFRRISGRRETAREELGLQPDDFVIGAIGRLGPEKRFDVLLEACARVVSRGSHVRVLIAGDGALRATLEAQAARLFKPGVCRLLGHCSDVIHLHHCLDLFILSSAHEGSPNVVLEAMALETPLVATRVGGTVQMVRDGIDGLLVPPADPVALARAIEEAMDDQVARLARARAARLRVAHELSFDARQHVLEKLYEDLTQDRLHGDRIQTSVKWA